MFVGTLDVSQSAQLLCDYVDNPGDYRWAWRGLYEGRPSVFLADGPGQFWEGARAVDGTPLG